MSWSPDVYKIRRQCSSTCSMSSENIDGLRRMVAKQVARTPYSGKPITFSRCKSYKRSCMLQKSSSDLIKKTQQKGIIFIWPQKKSFYYEREYATFSRILAQLLYWCDVFGIIPSGKGVPLKRPPWKIEPPIPTPENRDYIIEPDWNSVYMT